MYRFNMTKILIVLFALIASILANIPLQDKYKTVINTIEYTNIPKQYKFNPNSTAVVSSGFVQQTYTGGHRIIITNFNEFADKIFGNIDRMILGGRLDPAPLPDIHSGFSHEILFIKYHGDFDLTNGALNGVSTIHRGPGNVVVTYNSQKRLFEVTVPITFYDLGFNYDYSVKFMGLGPKGGVIGKVSSVEVEVKLSFNFNTFQAALDNFYIRDTSHITFKFTGNILVDWLSNIISGIATTLLKGVILLVIEGIVRGTLDTAVNVANEVITRILNSTTSAGNIPTYHLGSHAPQK